MTASAAVRCSGCPAMIRFIRTQAGRHMPVDADPIAVRIASGLRGAQVVTLVDAAGVVHRGTIVDAPGGTFLEGYTPHWATCPNRRVFARNAR